MVRVADAGIANALLQLLSNPLAFCPGRRHPLDKSFHVSGKIVVPVLGKYIGDRSPAAFNRFPCFHECMFAGFAADIPFEQFGRDGLSLGADVRGIAPQARAIDAIFSCFSSLAADRTLGGIRRYAKQP